MNYDDSRGAAESNRSHSPSGFGNFRFLPGRMEETGKKVFLPVSSRRKWKKLEESGRNWKKCMSNVNANKVLERSSQIQWSNTVTSMQICNSQNSWILQGSIDLLSNILGLGMFQFLHLQATLWLQDQRYNINFHKLSFWLLFQFTNFFQNCLKMDDH